MMRFLRILGWSLVAIVGIAITVPPLEKGNR
jgi:hypothetical protein